MTGFPIMGFVVSVKYKWSRNKFIAASSLKKMLVFWIYWLQTDSDASTHKMGVS
jgi:hypothetical protein